MAAPVGNAPVVALETSNLLALTDDLLLHIIAHLDPYPHSFLLGRTCKRLHVLVGSDALRLLVSPAAAGAGAPGTARTPRPPCRAAFATVAAAVAASRPGDTIVVEADRTHACANVALRWPVRLVGGELEPRTDGGSCASSSEAAPPPPPMPTLAAAGNAATILDVSASCLLHGLHIVAPKTGGPCVWHTAGVLRITHCSMQGVVRPDFSGLSPRQSVSDLHCLHAARVGMSSPILSTACDTDGRDCVLVEETRIAGGKHVQAARWQGDRAGEAIADTRVVPLPGKAGDLFWMRVQPLRPLLLPPLDTDERVEVALAGRSEDEAHPELCLHPPPPKVGAMRVHWCALAAAPAPG